MVETFISTTMNGKVHENLHQNLHDWENFEKFAMNANVPGQELSSRNAQNRRWKGSSLHHDPLHPRDGLIDVGQVWRTTQVINDADAVRLVSHRRRQSTVAAEYGSPPEVAGNAGAGVGLYVLTRPMAVH